MAELQDRLDITIEELEESLGGKKLPEFIKESEALFLGRIDRIVEDIIADSRKKAIFVSGPTSSGKTTFTMRLSQGLSRSGKKASFLSLDDYYKMSSLTFDEQGRPDFETIDALDVDRAASDIRRILNGEKVIPPYFDFQVRKSFEGDESRAIELPSDGVLVVEGLHGLSPRISGCFNDDECIKVFIMPYGNVYHDTKLMDRVEIRMLRRIVRDYRHRAAHALATIDYWPMIASSEQEFYDTYLKSATYHINSFLAYEPLVIAPMALHDINEALESCSDGTLTPNIFMERSETGKAFADLPNAILKAKKILKDLAEIPVIDPSWVPEASILNEFISS